MDNNIITEDKDKGLTESEGSDEVCIENQGKDKSKTEKEGKNKGCCGSKGSTVNKSCESESKDEELCKKVDENKHHSEGEPEDEHHSEGEPEDEGCSAREGEPEDEGCSAREGKHGGCCESEVDYEDYGENEEKDKSHNENEDESSSEVERELVILEPNEDITMEFLGIFSTLCGDPIAFSMYDCPEKARITSLVEENDGIMMPVPGGKHTIHLSSSGRRVITVRPTFSCQYVVDCIRDDALLSLIHYRMDQGNAVSESMLMKVMLAVESWPEVFTNVHVKQTPSFAASNVPHQDANSRGCTQYEEDSSSSSEEQSSLSMHKALFSLAIASSFVEPSSPSAGSDSSSAEPDSSSTEFDSSSTESESFSTGSESSNAGPASPGAGPASPGAGPASPSAGPASPSAGPASPSAGPASPSAGPASPSSGSASPSSGSASPSSGPASLSAGPASLSAGPASLSAGPALPSAGPASPSAGPALVKRDKPFHRPAALNQARWMTKAIYYLKLQMLKSQLSLTGREKAGTERVSLFVALVHCKKWHEVSIPVESNVERFAFPRDPQDTP
ncbi:BRCT domain [Trinorchestia longiramus]|nr:BRCT domain [Trinorchestia longiramus]